MGQVRGVRVAASSPRGGQGPRGREFDDEELAVAGQVGLLLLLLVVAPPERGRNGVPSFSCIILRTSEICRNSVSERWAGIGKSHFASQSTHARNLGDSERGLGRGVAAFGL